MDQASQRILLTGGAGYIGAHTYVSLFEAGFTPIVLDDFSHGHPNVIKRLERITGAPVLLEKGSILDTRWVEHVLDRHRPMGVIHLAGHKAVGESVANPLKYFHNNIGGAISLIRAMEAFYLTRQPGLDPVLVFSSSATVYGDPVKMPITEDYPLSHTNPYGHTKLVTEQMLNAVRKAQPSWRIGILRYFNPIGAHSSGLIGDDQDSAPNNLMPYVTQVAVGLRPYLNVFGHDYPTPDGTAVRDYIHVQDLATGHVAAIRTLLAHKNSFTVNLGTGRGYSVLEVIRAFECATGKPLPYKLSGRRPGDIAQCYADSATAKQLLDWEAKLTLQEMCADAWRWQSANPRGYVETNPDVEN